MKIPKPRKGGHALGRVDAFALAVAFSHSGLRNWVVIGFVQALDFAAVEALITNRKPCAEGLGCVRYSTATKKGG